MRSKEPHWELDHRTPASAAFKHELEHTNAAFIDDEIRMPGGAAYSQYRLELDWYRLASGREREKSSRSVCPSFRGLVPLLIAAAGCVVA
jgi:hypothetical protein